MAGMADVKAWALTRKGKKPAPKVPAGKAEKDNGGDQSMEQENSSAPPTKAPPTGDKEQGGTPPPPPAKKANPFASFAKKGKEKKAPPFGGKKAPPFTKEDGGK